MKQSFWLGSTYNILQFFPQLFFCNILSRLNYSDIKCEKYLFFVIKLGLFEAKLWSNQVKILKLVPAFHLFCLHFQKNRTGKYIWLSRQIMLWKVCFYTFCVRKSIKIEEKYCSFKVFNALLLLIVKCRQKSLLPKLTTRNGLLKDFSMKALEIRIFLFYTSFW